MQIVLKCTSTQSYIQGKKVKHTASFEGKDCYLTLTCAKNEFKISQRYKLTLEDIK